MAELEELKLVVSLTDNASPQLVQLRRQLEDLGGGSQAGNLHRVSRETRELNEQIKELIKSIGEGPKALAEFARGAGTFGLVVGSFALIADKAARALRDYSSEVVKMSQAADMAGISTAQYHKNLEALQRSGLGGIGPQLIQQMSKAFDDFRRINSEGVQRLREMAFAQPELGAIINRQVERLRSAVSPEDIVKRAKETANAVADYYRRQGASEQTIAQQKDETYRRMGFDPRIQFAEEMAATTHEENELWEKRRQTTLNYYRDSTRIIQSFNEAIRNIDINTMERLSGVVAGIADSMEKIAHASKDIKVDWIDILSAPLSFLFGSAQHGSDLARSKDRKETSPAAPPSRGGGGGGGAWLMSPTGGGSLLMPGELPHDPGRRLSSDEYLSHIIAGTRDAPTEDRRGEVFAAAGGTRERVTLLNANTAELRKLNDYLSGTARAPTGAYGFLSGGAGGGGGALAGAVATRMGGLQPGYGDGRGKVAPPMGPLPSMPRVGPGPSGPAPSGPAPSGPGPSGPGPSGPGPSSPAPSGPYGMRGGPSVMPGAAPIRPTGGGFQPGPAGPPQPDSGATGSAYLAEQRAHLFEELDRDPAAKKFVSQVLEHENEGSPEAYAAVLEAWANRANFAGDRSLRQGAGAFFGPVQRGELREVSPAKQRQIDEAIRMVRGGSNLIEGRTDQGMINEHPYAGQVGAAAARLRRIHGEYFSDKGPAEAEFSRRQQARVRGEGPRSVPGAPSNLEMLRVRPGEAGDVSGLLGGQTRVPTAGPIAAMAGAPIAAGAVPAVGGGGPQAFIMHHTSGRGTVEGVKSTLQGRRLGVQYIMDREGNITQYSGPGAAHMLPGWGLGAGLRNANVVGMEVIAKNDADVTPAQVAAAVAFMERNYPNTPIFGHGQVNPGHKEADEGMTIKNAIDLSRSQRIAAPVTALKTRTVDFNLDRDVLDLAMSKDIKQVKGTADVNVKVGGGAKDEEEREKPPYRKTDVTVPTQAEKARSGDEPKKGGQTAEDHDPSLDS